MFELNPTIIVKGIKKVKFYDLFNYFTSKWNFNKYFMINIIINNKRFQ